MTDRAGLASTPPTESCLHEWFSLQARAHSERPALTFGPRTMTYAEVEDRALRLATHLQRRGVRRGQLVAVKMAPSAAAVCAVLGVTLAGGAYVPIDAEYPLERARFMVRDSGARLLVTDDPDEALAPEVDCVRLEQDSDFSALGEAADYRVPDSHPGDLLYVIYTSGSTGTPKGVEVEHRNVWRLFSATRDWFRFSEDDVWTLFHSLAFDFSVWELWGALLHGGRLVVVPRPVARSTGDFLALLQSERVTVLNQTPSAFAELIRVEAREDSPEARTLRLVVLGGEALRFATLEPWFRRHTDSSPQVVNMYGITETTVHVTYRRVGAGDVARPESVIGVPIPDLKTYVVKQGSDPALSPPGEVGELYVGGGGVSRGYRNRPDLTGERFIPNPFEELPPVLYRSGDLVRLNQDGELEYVGRADRQLKVRGYRIEPGELEAAILTHPGVQEAAVVTHPGSDGVESIVAYVVAHSSGPLPVGAEIRTYLRARLPSFMVPERIVLLDKLPRTGNGKVDRDALVHHGDERSSDAPKYVPPQDQLQHQVVAIWEELLGVQPIGIQDDFFDLGGHSLLAVRMVRQVGLAIGGEVPVTLLYEHRTIEALTRALVQAGAGTSANPVTVIRAEGSRPPLFFLHGDHQGGGFYCIDLGRKISPEQPVYGLQPHGIDNLPVPASVAEMARFYIPIIRSVRPRGPYCLAGYRPAGYVALEIAQQLRESGDDVPVVVMIDPGRPKRRVRLAQAVVASAGRLVGASEERRVEAFLRLQEGFHRLKRMRGDTLGRAGGAAPLDGEDPGTVRLRQAVQSRAAEDALRSRSPRPNWRLTGDESDLSRWSRAERHEEEFGRYAWATSSYRPRPYAGRVVIFWSRDAAEVPTTAPGTTRWWQQFLSDLEAHYVPGDHASSVTRWADLLAAELRVCLDPRSWPDPERS